jgi:molecular chaperone DnaK
VVAEVKVALLEKVEGEVASVVDNSIIRIGIDLGTTNSEISANIDGDAEVVKNTQGDEYTPSVFGIDKAGNELVGRKAYDKLFKSSSNSESQNFKAEVKRLMGTSEKVEFQRAGKSLSPEEVSSKILISLKNDLLRKYSDFDTKGAVITVPAYFNTLQNEATKRAGKLAGFDYVTLLQEPIAAAMAYGFKQDINENWLVFDFGGGTFDAALISSKDGIMSVIEHGGDNFLGGKDIDNLLIEEILVPAISAEFSIIDFSDTNEKYKGTLAKLKYIAEAAKIDLSEYENISIEIDDIGQDDNGEEIFKVIEYSRDDFNKLIKPIVDKAIDVSKEVINKSGLSSDSISKAVFVGGPTQIP